MMAVRLQQQRGAAADEAAEEQMRSGFQLRRRISTSMSTSAQAERQSHCFDFDRRRSDSDSNSRQRRRENRILLWQRDCACSM